MATAREVSQVHKNGNSAGFGQALFAVAREMKRTHGKQEAADALIAAAEDLRMLPELRRSLSALKGRK